LPAPVSMTAIPAVACGTKTFSSPSRPAAASRRNASQSPVRSTTRSSEPVETVRTRVVKVPDMLPILTHPPAHARQHGARAAEAGRVARRPSGPTRTTPVRARERHAATPGDLDVIQADRARLGSHAHTLSTQLWDEARLDDTSVDKAASDLT